MRVSTAKIQEVALQVRDAATPHIVRNGSIDAPTLQRLWKEVGFNPRSDRTMQLLQEALCSM